MPCILGFSFKFNWAPIFNLIFFNEFNKFELGGGFNLKYPSCCHYNYKFESGHWNKKTRRATVQIIVYRLCEEREYNFVPNEFRVHKAFTL